MPTETSFKPRLASRFFLELIQQLLPSGPTIEGSVNSPPPPDHFSAVYSGDFSFTVNDDRTLQGSGTVRKTYTISEWPCPTVQNTLQGSIGVSGNVDPTYNMLTLVFTVTQTSQAADESCSGIQEHIYGATDGFNGLRVNMRYGQGEVSSWISQLPCCSDQIRFRLGTVTYQTTSTISSPTTSNAPGQLQVNILGCPSTVNSGDSVQLSTKWGATSPPDLALPNPAGQLSYSWAAEAGTFSSPLDSATTWWAPSVSSETQVTISVQVSSPSYSSAGDSCVITVEPPSGQGPGTNASASGGGSTFYIFVIIVVFIVGAYVWNKQRHDEPVQQFQTQTLPRQTTAVQGKFHGHWEDKNGFAGGPDWPGPGMTGQFMGPYKWVSPEEEQQRADAMKRSDEWFKQHPPEHRTPPQTPPRRPTVTFGRHSCPNCGEPGQSGKFCTKCGTKF